MLKIIIPCLVGLLLLVILIRTYILTGAYKNGILYELYQDRKAGKPGPKSVFGAIRMFLSRLLAVLVRLAYVYRGIVMVLYLGIVVASAIFGEWKNAGMCLLALLFFAPEIRYIINQIRGRNSKKEKEDSRQAKNGNL